MSSVASPDGSLKQEETSIQLDWGFWDAQLETLDAIRSGAYDLVIFRGGYGSGKTVLGGRWIHEVSLAIPGSHNLALAPDYQKGGPATYQGFFEQLPGENTVPNDADGDPENSPIVAGYNANEKRLTYINGSVARLGSADTWNRYAGSEFNAIWCDEVAHYDHTDLYDLHEMLVTRQRTPNGPNVTLWTSTGNGYNQFYDISERQVDQSDAELPWRDRMEVIVADSRNNPFHHAMGKMKAQFEGTERESQALKGGFAAAEGLVYEQFSRKTHVRSRADVEIVDDWRMYGYDYGWKDPRVIIEFAKTPADQYVAWDCYYVSGKPVEHAIDWLKTNEKPVGSIYCDHDPEHIDKFRQAGYPAEAATKNLDEGISEVQEVLEVDPDVGPGLIVIDELTELIKEFQSYKEDDVGTSKADDHCLDVTRYGVMGDRYVEEDDDRLDSLPWR
ncbi:hypothetical protein [Natrarchaeobaculum sulfurireducens]|uniref:Terminase large subunit n=1 Tax=Natrarchaeobaculum sulfurireducens TaxID=2044521 RepID=A0A346PMQ2_9EURY|nr:hypothetical protein [Natrarchaeobaculum sulfurireducens]AXR80797.1 hypothetical protein AArcMg_0775 [Natrarchaeobaculum sulfurireducens]